LEIIKRGESHAERIVVATACQIETFSASQVSLGPTEIACSGYVGHHPPPEVRRFE